MAKSKATIAAVPSDDEWRARMDCDTLIECQKIEADPKRYKAALAEAKRRRDALDATLSDSADDMAEMLGGSKKD